MTTSLNLSQIPVLQTYPEGSVIEPREVIVMLTHVPCVGEAIRARAGQLMVAAVTPLCERGNRLSARRQRSGSPEGFSGRRSQRQFEP